MFEYNIYDNSDGKFIGTFSTLLELKQWVYKLSCDFNKETIKSNLQFFYSFKKAKAKQTQLLLEEWFNWQYRKEKIGTHHLYYDEFENIE